MYVQNNDTTTIYTATACSIFEEFKIISRLQHSEITSITTFAQLQNLQEMYTVNNQGIQTTLYRHTAFLAALKFTLPF